jgi:hypothetical protein
MANQEHHKPHLEKGELYPREIYDPPPKDGEEVPHYVHYMRKAEAGLEAGVRTVRMIVYAGMTAFVVLAIYGYYLIYQLTDDAARMTVTMDRMADSMVQMQATMQPMGQNMMVMTQSLMNMTESVNRIQNSAGHMDRSFSGPMNAFNRMMPFSNGGGDRAIYPATPFVPPTYTAPPARAFTGESPPAKQ